MSRWLNVPSSVVVPLLSMTAQILNKTSRKIMRCPCLCCYFALALSSTCRPSSLTLSWTIIHPSTFRATSTPGEFKPLSCVFSSTLYFSIESKRTVINVCVITSASSRLYKLHEGRNWSNLNKSNSMFLLENKDTNLYAWQIYTKTGTPYNLFTGA